MASVLGFAFTPAAVHRAAIQQNDDHEHKSADGPLVNRFYFLLKRVAIRVDIATKACDGELEIIIATRSGVLRLSITRNITSPQNADDDTIRIRKMGVYPYLMRAFTR